MVLHIFTVINKKSLKKITMSNELMIMNKCSIVF